MYKYIHIRPGVDRVKPLSDIFKIWNREEVTQSHFGNHKFNRTSQKAMESPKKPWKIMELCSVESHRFTDRIND